MKTLVETATGLSKYVFEDGASVTVNTDSIITPAFIIGDMNSSNTTLHENVTPPEDWAGCKYFFDGSSWTTNTDWVDPATLNEE